MKLSWTVHRAHDSTLSKTVNVDGTMVPAVIPCYEVELVSTDPHSGSYTKRFVGAEVEEAKKIFVTGQTVSAEF